MTLRSRRPLPLPVWLAASLLLACASAAKAQPPDFRPALDAAIRSHAARFVIPPGVYRLGPQPDTPNLEIISIRNASGLDVVADGVTVVCTERTRAMTINSCRSVSLRGMTVDYDPLSFTQGTVTEIAPDKGWIDVTISKGYSTSHEYTADNRVDFIDPQTRLRKKYNGQFPEGDRTLTWTAPDVVRVAQRNVGGFMALGDDVVFSEGGRKAGAIHYWDHGIVMEQSDGVVLRNVSLFCAPGFGFTVGAGCSRVRYLGCRLVPGPRPPGAALDRLATSSWDGMTGALDVENCRIEDSGDDAWGCQPNDPPAVFRHNYVHAAGRLLVKNGRGLFEDNTLDSSDGLVVGEAEDAEVRGGLVIRHNSFRGVRGFLPRPWASQAGAVSITDGKDAQFRPAGYFHDVLIEGNTFQDDYGPDIVVAGTRGLTIRDNVFRRSQQHPVYDRYEAADYDRHTYDKLNASLGHSVVWIGECDNVTLSHNALLPSDAGARPDRLITIVNTTNVR